MRFSAAAAAAAAAFFLSVQAAPVGPADSLELPSNLGTTEALNIISKVPVSDVTKLNRRSATIDSVKNSLPVGSVANRLPLDPITGLALRDVVSDGTLVKVHAGNLLSRAAVDSRTLVNNSPLLARSESGPVTEANNALLDEAHVHPGSVLKILNGVGPRDT